VARPGDVDDGDRSALGSPPAMSPTLGDRDRAGDREEDRRRSGAVFERERGDAARGDAERDPVANGDTLRRGW
jgi:hypothetical protein